MKVAFIHNDKKIGTGAHYINDLMASKLKESGVEVKNFYPKLSLVDAPVHLGGIKNILFFYSLLEHRKEMLKYDIIQGTTYTALPFLAYQVPVVCHFGSTTRGFIDSVPLAANMDNGCRSVWLRLKKERAISELNIKTRKPLRDIADVEEYVASRATAVIATSEKVKHELIESGVDKERIHLIHNAVEDYWFETAPTNQPLSTPHIVFLGRLGADAFTLKLKGLDRLVHLYQKFPNVQKSTFGMTTNKPLVSWLREKISNHDVHVSVQKDRLPNMLKSLRGSVLFVSSRYEGFSLSLVEGMSQGLIPISYPVGVAPEIIEDGVNGFIVKSQAEAIDKVSRILTDDDVRERMSRAAISSASKFSSDEIAKKLMKLYDYILKTTTVATDII